MEVLNHKLETLKSFVREKGKDGVVIAFSGGVDSSTLAAVSQQVLGGLGSGCYCQVSNVHV